MQCSRVREHVVWRFLEFIRVLTHAATLPTRPWPERPEESP